MKRMFIVGLLMIYSFNGFSQNSKLNLDINFPIPIGDNFIGKNYTGIFDLGVKYNFFKLKKLKFCVSTNVGLLTYNSDMPVKALMIKPRFNTELTLGKFSPFTGIGYSFFNYITDSKAADLDKTSDGLNVNLGFKLTILSKVYLNFSYDFIKFRTEKAINSSYNSNIQILEIGVGMNI